MGEKAVDEHGVCESDKKRYERVDDGGKTNDVDEETESKVSEQDGGRKALRKVLIDAGGKEEVSVSEVEPGKEQEQNASGCSGRE